METYDICVCYIIYGRKYSISDKCVCVCLCVCVRQGRNVKRLYCNFFSSSFFFVVVVFDKNGDIVLENEIFRWGRGVWGVETRGRKRGIVARYGRGVLVVGSLLLLVWRFIQTAFSFFFSICLLTNTSSQGRAMPCVIERVVLFVLRAILTSEKKHSAFFVTKKTS